MKKKSIRNISIKVLLTALCSVFSLTYAFGQEAEEYFHNGAQSFIAANLQEAISHVQEGLSQYPDHPKLNALLQKLEEEQKKQQQQQQQNQEQEQQQEQQNQDQNQQQQDQQDQSEQEQNQNQEQQGEEGESEQQPMDTEQLESQQISKEDAEKILQALSQKEKELLKEFKKQTKEGSAKHDKDW